MRGATARFQRVLDDDSVAISLLIEVHHAFRTPFDKAEEQVGDALLITVCEFLASRR